MVRSFRVLAGFAFLAIPAAAQSFNVDFGPAGSPLGVPSPAYGASNGKPGVWNKVSSTDAWLLRRWDGTPTTVSLHAVGNPPECPATGNARFFTHEFPGVSGDDAVIFDELFSAGDWDDNGNEWYFDGLEAGDYVVDTIVAQAGCCNDLMDVYVGTHVQSWGDQRTVLGAPGPFVESGPWPPVPHSNFTRHHVSTDTGIISIIVGVNDPYSEMVTNICAIQIEKVGDREITGVPVCAGDGIAASCPCANSGLSGVGCQNSAGTGGSWLVATGATSPDTVVLHASGELPHALSVFLQGNSIVNPIHYGDGLRCTGGTLKRLYTKSAVSGVVFAPGAGDPSITVQSANLGVPIVPGGRRYYQVFYRDANPGFCPSPTGSTFNVSNGVRIDW